ncbi:hypothetical protein JQN72_04430 [Phycicoccus sp. CSK15P-2]|uniref:hypothetical protein n=1 Tax=Phycicoccus sp. CSK15P-2 TaxID=2807627 RepID=UPI001950870B|nr:hypothetical protein [Phycicoccus sp. CSK15P-2]MBM6403489.1 hypothetical protein [Phycicoccus sp. CSK15P-2]
MVAKRPQVGDVFTIPTGDGRAGIGQVVATYGKDAYFLAVFERVVPEGDSSSAATEALSGVVRFLALSLDAKFHAGHWPIVTQAPVRADLPLPAYKEAVTTADHIDVVDYSGTRRRRASRDEAALLSNRKVVAPVRLERALRASLGLEPWLEAFDDLRPHGITTREAFA